MSSKKHKAPVIRFEGFTKAWEQRKLISEIDKVLDYRGKSPTKFGMQWESTGYLVLSALNVKDGYIDKAVDAKCGNQALFERWMGFERLEKGDVIFTTEAPLGNVAQIPDDDGYILNQRAVGFKTKPDNLNNNFLAQLLRSPLFQDVLQANASGGTAKGIGMKEFAKLDVMIPLEIVEQKQIGNFFNLIDDTIDLHQSQLNDHKQLKKSMLQKMFPQDGENVPEVRFEGFTEEWEQRKLGELLFPADERNNAGKYTQDDVLAASLGTELVKKHIFFGLRSTEESVKNYRVVNSGDVIYTKSPIKGYPNGIIRTNKGLDGIVPSLYCVYRSIPSINSSIIQNYFEDNGRLDAYLYPLVNIGARNNVNITDLGFLEGTIFISQDIDEQNKIVNFFNHLTSLIDLHQQKVNDYLQLKNAMFQQLFV